jgi:hypothetical protein
MLNPAGIINAYDRLGRFEEFSLYASILLPSQHRP